MIVIYTLIEERTANTVGVVNVSPNSAMKVPRGLKLCDIETGKGRHAVPGDTVRFEYELRFNRGELIADSSEHGPLDYRLGCRDCAPGVEYGLMGMREGGIRTAKVPPHLTYVDRQINSSIPGNAVIIYTLTLLKILDTPPWDPEMSSRLDCTKIHVSSEN